MEPIIDIDETSDYLMYVNSSSVELCVRENDAVYFPGNTIYDDERLKKHCGKYKLPHWELDQTIYHVCFRLSDSVPKEKQELWRQERMAIINPALNPFRQLTNDEMKRLQYLYSERIEKYLDAGYGECLLKNPEFAQILKDSLYFYNDIKYVLHSWCIMPNHVHVAFNLIDDNSLSKVLFGWKSFTAHKINKILARTGQLWQRDCYNHIIRSKDEYYVQMRYIWQNPDKAGLAQWPWRWMCLDTQNVWV